MNAATPRNFPVPEREKPNPGMTWAELARKEGHRKTPKSFFAPVQKQSGSGRRRSLVREAILAAMAPGEIMTGPQILEASGVNRTSIYCVLGRLADEGIIVKHGNINTRTYQMVQK